ncbi:MAG: DUF1566 domain-containing protein [Proteobacteria bacterium]|jgi:hypothetical protein|nr:DUF1566 domain-containing protein [Pseudomonadota bacterium]
MHNAHRVLLILVVLTAAACGAPALPTGPAVTPPSGGGGGKYQCKNVSGKTDPWLVEWDATQKARMQATSQSGVLLVRYTGCDLEVLYGCERQGQYKLVPTTPASSTEYITSEDEVFAKLPIGALSLVAEFQQGDKWSLDYVIVGMRQASISAIKREELSGECAQATHYISGMAVGAYQLTSAARRMAGGGATVYGAGAGASSGAAVGALRQDGRYEKCNSDDATADDPRCQAIVQLFLEPLVEGIASSPASSIGTSQPPTGTTKDYYGSLATEGPPAPIGFDEKQYKADMEKAWAAVKKAAKGSSSQNQLEMYQRFLTDFPVDNPYADKARKDVDRLDAQLTKEAEANAAAAQKAATLAAEKEKAELMRQAYEAAKNAHGSASDRLAKWQRFVQAYPGSDNPYLATAQREIVQLEPQVETERQSAAGTAAQATAATAEQQRLAAERARLEEEAKKKVAEATQSREVQQPGTNLYWLRCPLGQTWSGSVCIREAMQMDWNAAMHACPSGYRLPTRQEFIDLLGGCDSDVGNEKSGNCKKCGLSDSCNRMFEFKTGLFWSSSTDDDYAWRSSFSDGGVGKARVKYEVSVRCVRSGS